jgi:hypothetical protein
VQLVITGDLEDPHGHHAGRIIWRVPFEGWGATHVLRVEHRPCRPRRYAVFDGERLVSDGYTDDPELIRGDEFRIRVEEPPPP